MTNLDDLHAQLLKGAGLDRVCLLCGAPAASQTTPLEPPASYAPSPAAYVRAFAPAGTAKICAQCAAVAATATWANHDVSKRIIAFVSHDNARHGIPWMNDVNGVFLLADLIEYAWWHTRDPYSGIMPSPALAAAIVILARFPIAPLVEGDRLGVLSMTTRDLGNDVAVGIGSRPNGLLLHDFYSRDRGHGHGERAMTTLCEIADEHHAPMFGDAVPHSNRGGAGPIPSLERLVRWYGTFGFTVVDATDPTRPKIRREPRSPQSRREEEAT